MLLLGSEMIAQSFDAQYQDAARSASRKVEAVLTPKAQEDVAYLKENIRFISMNSRTFLDLPDKLQKLRRAILEQRSLHLNYFKRAGQGGELTERTVDPHGLIYFNGTWMLSAYCHLRQAMRMFRLERIREVELLADTFTRQKDFSVHDLRAPQGQSVTVDLLFDSEVAQWVRERPAFHKGSYENVPEGLKVTLNVHHVDEALPWILSWGAKVKVLGPEHLKKRLHKELGAMQQKLNALSEANP